MGLTLPMSLRQDAGSSEWSRASYRGLVSLHDSCSQLVNMVEQTAAIMRQARRLEETVRGSDNAAGA